MIRYSNKSKGMALASIVVLLLLALVIGCAQPAPTPTPAPTAPPKAAPTQAPKPAAAKETKPEAKVATPETKAAKPAVKEAKPEKPAQKQPLVKLTVPYSAVAGSHTVLFVAKEKGLFEKYGLDVDIPYVATSTTLVQSLVSGEVKLAHAGGGAVVAASLAGSDAIAIAGTANLMGSSLWGQPNIKRPEDLKGKIVAVSRFGSASDFGTRFALRKFGIDPEKDVTIVQAGGMAEGLAALLSGGVQGAAFGPPISLQAKKAGMNEVISYPDTGVAYATAIIVTTKRYLNSNKETVRNFLKAFVEGLAVAKKEKEFTMNAIGKYTNTTDREVLSETYDFYVTRLFPKVPYAGVEAMQAILDETARANPKAKDAKVDSVVDNSLMKELEDSGFVKEAYGEK
ncbi:MAG: ABC transporter substrate-binding protein [Chloroflexi bacterium]|nr:ABC transporter substrate-binding protein [Chloroflexota bacterium]